MTIFLAIGALFLFFSYLFFFAPSTIVKMSEIGNRMVFADYKSVAYRKVTGTILLGSALLMFYVGIGLY